MQNNVMNAVNAVQCEPRRRGWQGPRGRRRGSACPERGSAARGSFLRPGPGRVWLRCRTALGFPGQSRPRLRNCEIDQTSRLQIAAGFPQILLNGGSLCRDTRRSWGTRSLLAGIGPFFFPWPRATF